VVFIGAVWQKCSNAARSPGLRGCLVADSGLLHRLLGIETRDALLRHPKLGAGLDLLVARGGRRIGFEFKRTVAPEFAKSMRIALADLRLQRLDAIHAGERTYPLAPHVRAVALARVLQDIPPL
jgi:hypothetical protein